MVSTSNCLKCHFTTVLENTPFLLYSNKNTCIHAQAHAHIYSIHTRTKTQRGVSVRTLEWKPLKWLNNKLVPNCSTDFQSTKI